MPAPVSEKPEPSKAAAEGLDAETLALEEAAELEAAALELADPPQPDKAMARTAAHAAIAIFFMLFPSLVT